MDFILGSLIVLSILSTPADKISSNLIQSGIINLKKQRKIVKEEIKNEVTFEDIQSLICEIDNNFLTINSLKLKKINEQNIFKQKMNSFIKSKQKFTQTQIESFKNYSNLIEKDIQNIDIHQNSLKDKKLFLSLQNDLISNSNNLHIIYKKLYKILKNQLNMIENLYKIIFNIKCCAEIF